MDPSDVGYDERLGRRAHILLNGAPLAYCITADEEAGEVVVIVRDARGRPALSENGKRLTQRIWGDVKIVIGAP
ncbi:MAG TPA: hypothetical protein PLS69_05935 [Terricaulis sp.]|nr:hypothetical protein [Terricaulis sp.]